MCLCGFDKIAQAPIVGKLGFALFFLASIWVSSGSSISTLLHTFTARMPQTFISTWRTVEHLLQVLSKQANPTADAASVVTVVARATDSWQKCEFVSRANWKQLIKEMQIPKKLATLCCSVSFSSLSSSNTSSQYAFAAWHALVSFLQRASADLLRDKQGNIHIGKANSSSLPRCMTEQLEQCGFLQSLPSMLAAVAKLLQDNTTAAAADTTLLQPAADGVDYYFETVVRLLDTALVLVTFQARADDPTLWEASAGLCMSVMRRISTAMQLLPAAALHADSAHSRAASVALNYALTLSSVMGACTNPQLFDCPDVAAVASVFAFCTYTRQLLPAKTTDSASSSREGERVAAGAASVAAAAAAFMQQQEQFSWHSAAAACVQQQHQEQQHADACLRVTGVSIEVAAYIAAHMSTQKAAVALLQAAAAAFGMVDRCQEQQRQRRQGQKLSEQQLRQLWHHLLLGQVLLCALGRQYSSSTFVHECNAVALMATNAVKVVGSCQDPEQVQAQCVVLRMWLVKVMPVVLRLMSHIQTQLSTLAAARNPTAAAAAGAASRAGSSSSSGDPSVADLNKQFCDHNPAGSLVELIAAAVTFTNSAPAVQPLTADEPAAAALRNPSHVQYTQHYTQQVPCWQAHSGQLSTLLDGLLRLQVRCLAGAQQQMHVQRIIQAIANHLIGDDQGLQLTVFVAGPGSKEHVQLFSMQCSLLKLAAHMCAQLGGVGAAAAACWQVAASARSMLTNQALGLCAGMQGAALVGDSAAAAPVSSQLDGAGRAEKAVDGLPSLVLLGRCFLQWAAELQRLQQVTPDLGARLLQLCNSDQVGSSAVMEVLKVGHMHAAAALCIKPVAEVSLCLDACGAWFVSGMVQRELEAAGYPVKDVLLQLDATLTALGVLVGGACDADSAAAAYSDLVAQLQALGMVLNTLAVPHACNNPACSNMAGPTELASVSGRSNACAGCLTARYCSRVCQKQHWKQHKPVCKALAAAAAPPAAP